jgi:hypothetical protein
MNPSATLESAFLEPQFKTIGDFHLRPFTLGSLPVCKKLGLTQFTGGAEGPLDQTEQLRQVAGFLWAHCEPVEHVLRALRKSPGDLEDELLRYQLQIPITLLPEILAEIERVGAMASAAQVEIVEKPTPAGATQAAPPGN